MKPAEGLARQRQGSCDHCSEPLRDLSDRNPRCAVMASAFMVALVCVLRGGQEPAGPILIGYRFEAKRLHPRVVTLLWSPRLYFAVYSFSSLKEHVLRSFSREYAPRPT